MPAPTPELVLDAPPVRLRPAHVLPDLVLRPVPVSEPPYDDELPSHTGPHLSLVPTLPASVGPLAHLPVLRLVAPAPAAAPVVPAAPAVRPAARALVQGLLEVLGGVRPVSQLRRRTVPHLCADLEDLVHASPRPVGARPPTGSVLSLHVQQPSATVAEVCATVRRGPRAGALALRLELEDGGWICTAVSGLGPEDLPRARDDEDDPGS